MEGQWLVKNGAHCCIHGLGRGWGPSLHLYGGGGSDMIVISNMGSVLNSSCLLLSQNIRVNNDWSSISWSMRSRNVSQTHSHSKFDIPFPGL